MKKLNELKDSKIQRHQKAKEKFKFFQRSISCTSFNVKTDFIPVPGQFALITNKNKQKTQGLPSIYNASKVANPSNEIKFTTNLKLITKQKSPSRVSQVMTEAVNFKIQKNLQQKSSGNQLNVGSLKKLRKCESTSTLRPISAQIIQQTVEQGQKYLIQSRVIKQAMQHDKQYFLRKQVTSNNSFLLKSRSPVPKHLYGHRSIRLAQSKPQLTLSKPSPQVQQQSAVAVQSFLPVQYYMTDDMSPQRLIQQYRLNNDVLVGWSKWFGLDGQFQWRKCRVIRFDNQQERWHIQWLHNGKNKMVARNVLRFQNQSFKEFNRVVDVAANFRRQNQVFMKYNLLVDIMKDPTHQLEDHQIKRILKLTQNKKYPTLKSIPSDKHTLSTESLVKANHQVQFNASLPYNQKQKVQFQQFLPAQLFKTKVHTYNMKVNKKEQLIQKKQKGIIVLQQVKKQFATSSRRFNHQSALSSVSKIQILKFIVSKQYQLSLQSKLSSSSTSKLKYLSFVSQRPYTIKQVLNSLDKSTYQVVSKVNNIVGDVQYFVSKELDPLYINKKNLQHKQFNAIVYKYRKFLQMVNLRIQNIAKNIFIQILNQFKQLLSTTYPTINKKDTLYKLKKQQGIVQKDLVDKKVDDQTNSIDQKMQIGQISQKQIVPRNLSSLVCLSQQKQVPLLLIKISIQIKQNIVQCSPPIIQIFPKLKLFIENIFKQFSQLGCIRKSYIPQLRMKNLMKVLEVLKPVNINDQDGISIWEMAKDVRQLQLQVNSLLDQVQIKFYHFYQQINHILTNIVNLQHDIRKKAQKKCTYLEIQQLIQTIKRLQSKLIQLVKMGVQTKKYEQMLGTKTEQNRIKQFNMAIFQNFISNALHINRSKHIILGPFKITYLQFLSKSIIKLQQSSIQLYKLIIQKVSKQSQKLQKQIESIVLTIQKQPKNIKEMIAIEHFINQSAVEEMYIVNSKIKQLQERFQMISGLAGIGNWAYALGILPADNPLNVIQFQYKQFYECHRIYLAPLHVKKKILWRLKTIQSQYKKTFGQSLSQSSSDLLIQIKQIETKYYLLLQNLHSIEAMDSSFGQFSKLKEKIEMALGRMGEINQCQLAMKWIGTNFTRLDQLRDQFQPYYLLASLHKNFKFHIESQVYESLHLIDAHNLAEEVLHGCQELSNLETNVFSKNIILLSIVRQVAQSYKGFRQKILLFQILRNTDLRDRHWNSIKQLTGFNDILSDKITFNQLQLRGIKKYEKKLVQISHIATRQLIYQKRLNKMKKSWKDVKVQLIRLNQKQKLSQGQSPTNSHQYTPSQQLQIISQQSLNEIQQHVQQDIFQIQQILSSSFIKFLEKDILQWRNLILYKIYQFFQMWNFVESQFLKMFYMFQKPYMRSQQQSQYYTKFKAIQKAWKNITMQIDQQTNLLQLLQTKISQSIKYLIQLIQDLQKCINIFFQKKKQRFSRFGNLSQDQLIALYSANPNSNETQNFDQAVKKCLQGVKSVVRENGKIITCIKTHLDQEIRIQEASNDNDHSKNFTPDKVIQDIEKRIKQSLKNSVQTIYQDKNTKILQIILFHQRIVFTSEIESMLTQQGSGIEQRYLNALVDLKQKIIQVLLNDCKNQAQTCKGIQKSSEQRNLLKIQAQLCQLINHLSIAQSLYHQQIQQRHNFQWVSQLRTYYHNKTYKIQIGLNTFQYGFELTDQQDYILEVNSQRMFFNVMMGFKERMFLALRGQAGIGKLAAIHYLANIHGRNQSVLNCHPVTSYDNIYDYFRMAANGIWILFNNLNLLSQNVLSCLTQSSQTFWTNFPSSKLKGTFQLGNKQISLTTCEISIFSTLSVTFSNKSEIDLISNTLKQFFRTVNMPQLDLHFIFQCKLLLNGFQYCSNTKKIIEMIKIIKQMTQQYYQSKAMIKGLEVYKGLTFSKIQFLNHLINHAIQIRISNYKIQKQNQKSPQYNSENYIVEDYLLLEMALYKGIQQITRNLGDLNDRIIQKLQFHFNFYVNLPFKQNEKIQTCEQKQLTFQQGYQKSDNQKLQKGKGQQKSLQADKMTQSQNPQSLIKALLAQHKLSASSQTIKNYLDLLTILSSKPSVILLGNCSTGKSTLIKLLQTNYLTNTNQSVDYHSNKQIVKENQKKQFICGLGMDLKYLHPNAYSLIELYGDRINDGLVNSLIRKCFQQSKSLKQKTLNTNHSIDSQTHLPKPHNFINEQQQNIVSSNQPLQKILSLNQQPIKVINYGIVFSSQIKSWIQPLLPLIKQSTTYTQPNGKHLLIQQPIKFIFECRDLSNVSPSIILCTNIVHLRENIKWQSVFTKYIYMKFDQKYHKRGFISFSQQLAAFILQPVLEFFRNSILKASQSKSKAPESLAKSKTFDSSTKTEYSSSIKADTSHNQFYSNYYLNNEANCIPLIFNLFYALIESHFSALSPNSINTQQKNDLSSKQQAAKTNPQNLFSLVQKMNQSSRKQAGQKSVKTDKKPQPCLNIIQILSLFPPTLDDKSKSQLLNIFILAITYSIGLFIPEESKKTFSRHLKYLVKRAVQLNIKGIDKDTLLQEEDQLFQMGFVNNRWVKWHQIKHLNLANTLMNNAIMTNTSQGQQPKSMQHSMDINSSNSFKYHYLMTSYLYTGQPFFLLGQTSSARNRVCLSYLSKLPHLTHNLLSIPISSNSSHFTAKSMLSQQIYKEKYSQTFKGFVHGKITVIYLCDMNLPQLKTNSSLDQWVYSYWTHNGWYMNGKEDIYQFNKINFCGTLNKSVNVSQHLLKYMNPISFTISASQVKQKIYQILCSNPLLSDYKQSITKLITNLHQVIERQFSHRYLIRFSNQDLLGLASRLVQLVNPSLINPKITQYQKSQQKRGQKRQPSEDQKYQKESILKCWIYETQRIYLQKFGPNYDQQKIFYFINNVLMQQERIRYKTLVPNGDLLISNLSYYLTKLNISSQITPHLKPVPKSTKAKSVQSHVLKSSRTSQISTFIPMNTYSCYGDLKDLKAELTLLVQYYRRHQKAAARADKVADSRKDGTINHNNLERQQEIQSQVLQILAMRSLTIDKLKQTVTNKRSEIRTVFDFLSKLEQNRSIIFYFQEIYEKTSQSNNTITLHNQKKQTQLEANFITQINKYSQEQIQQPSQLSVLLNCVLKINQYQQISYPHEQSSFCSSYLQWKIFMNQLFQIILSPQTVGLGDSYVIVFNQINKGEQFILEDLLQITRTSTFQILQNYVKTIAVQNNFDSSQPNSVKHKSQFKNQQISMSNKVYSQQSSQENEQSQQKDNTIHKNSNLSVHASKKLISQSKKISKDKKLSQPLLNKIKFAREKILSKLKFVININQANYKMINEDYQILVQKSHIIWPYKKSQNQTENSQKSKLANNTRQVKSLNLNPNKDKLNQNCYEQNSNINSYQQKSQIDQNQQKSQINIGQQKSKINLGQQNIVLTQINDQHYKKDQKQQQRRLKDQQRKSKIISSTNKYLNSFKFQQLVAIYQSYYKQLNPEFVMNRLQSGKNNYNRSISQLEITNDQKVAISDQKPIPDQKLINETKQSNQMIWPLCFYEFLQVFNLISKNLDILIKNNVQKLRQRQIHFLNISKRFISQMQLILGQKKQNIDNKQNQRKQLLINIQKIQQQQFNYKKTFIKTQQIMITLNKQSTQHIQMYNKMVEIQRKFYNLIKNDLVQLLKSAKDKKIVPTNQIKFYLQTFAFVIAKKVKPQQSIFKQIVKDIMTGKTLKKLLLIQVQTNFGEKYNQKIVLLTEKTMLRLKQLIFKNLQKQFILLNKNPKELITILQKERQKYLFIESSFSEKTLMMLKNYFLALLIYYSKTQEQGVKNLNKKCVKCIKQSSRVTEQHSKSMKSKVYSKITSQLQGVRSSYSTIIKVIQACKNEYEALRTLQKQCIRILLLSVPIGQYNNDNNLNQQIPSSFEIPNKIYNFKNDHQQIQQQKKILDKDFLLLIQNDQTKNQLRVIQRLKQQVRRKKDQLQKITNIKDIILLITCLAMHFPELKQKQVNIQLKNLLKRQIQNLKSFQFASWHNLFSQCMKSSLHMIQKQQLKSNFFIGLPSQINVNNFYQQVLKSLFFNMQLFRNTILLCQKCKESLGWLKDQEQNGLNQIFYVSSEVFVQILIKNNPTQPLNSQEDLFKYHQSIKKIQTSRKKIQDKYTGRQNFVESRTQISMIKLPILKTQKRQISQNKKVVRVFEQKKRRVSINLHGTILIVKIRSLKDLLQILELLHLQNQNSFIPTIFLPCLSQYKQILLMCENSVLLSYSKKIIQNDSQQLIQGYSSQGSLLHLGVLSKYVSGRFQEKDFKELEDSFEGILMDNTKSRDHKAQQNHFNHQSRSNHQHHINHQHQKYKNTLFKSDSHDKSDNNNHDQDRNLNLYHQYKQLEYQNLLEREKIIKNFHLFNSQEQFQQTMYGLKRSVIKKKKSILAQGISDQNEKGQKSVIDVQQTQQVQISKQKNKLLCELQKYMSQMHTNMSNYTIISNNLSSLSNPYVSKKKVIPIHYQKFIKYLMKIFVGLRLLQDQQIIAIKCLSIRKYYQHVQWMVGAEKQALKSHNQGVNSFASHANAHIKFFKSIKNQLLDYSLTLIHNQQGKILTSIIFATSSFQNVTYRDFQKYLHLIIQFYRYSTKLLAVDTKIITKNIESIIKRPTQQQNYNKKGISKSELQQNHLLKHFVIVQNVKPVINKQSKQSEQVQSSNTNTSKVIKQTVLLNIQSSNTQSTNNIKQKKQISAQFGQLLDLISSSFPIIFKDLRNDFKKKLDVWLQYFSKVEFRPQENINQILPQPYHDISRIYISLLVCLITPNKLISWINTYLVDEDLPRYQAKSWLSVEQTLIKFSKIGFKQVLLIGQYNLAKLYDLATRIRKPIKLFSPNFTLEEPRQFIDNNSPNQHKSSFSISRKQLGNQNSISRDSNLADHLKQGTLSPMQQMISEYHSGIIGKGFNQKSFIQNVQNTVKNANWLIIDIDGLVGSPKLDKNKNKYWPKIDYLVKLVQDQILTDMNQQADDELTSLSNTHQQIVVTQKSLLQSKAQLKLKLAGQGVEFNPLTYSNNQYMIIFTFSSEAYLTVSSQRSLKLLSILSSPYRFVIKTNHSKLERYVNLPVEYHQELLINKKGAKDYQQGLNFQLKKFILYLLLMVRQTMITIIHQRSNHIRYIKSSNHIQWLQSQTQSFISNDRLEQVSNRVLRLLNIIIQQPQTLNLILKQKHGHKSKSSKKVTSNDVQYQTKSKIKIGTKLKLQPCDQQPAQIQRKTNPRISIFQQHIPQPNQQLNQLFLIEESKKQEINRNSKLTGLMKIFFQYFKDTLGEKFYGLQKLWDFYLNNAKINQLAFPIQHNAITTQKSEKINQQQQQQLLSDLLIPINNKNLTNSPHTLEKVVQHLKSLNFKKQFIVGKNSLELNSQIFIDFKLFIERLFHFYPLLFSSENINLKIIQLSQVKKSLQNQLNSYKIELYKQELCGEKSSQKKNNSIKSISKQQRSSQFNFSSLTQNLTIQQMRKQFFIQNNSVIDKVSQNTKKLFIPIIPTISNSQNLDNQKFNSLDNSKNQIQLIKRIKYFLNCQRQKFLFDQIQPKINILKAIKPVFMLTKPNYQLLYQNIFKVFITKPLSTQKSQNQHVTNIFQLIIGILTSCESQIKHCQQIANNEKLMLYSAQQINNKQKIHQYPVLNLSFIEKQADLHSFIQLIKQTVALKQKIQPSQLIPRYKLQSKGRQKSNSNLKYNFLQKCCKLQGYRLRNCELVQKNQNLKKQKNLKNKLIEQNENKRYVLKFNSDIRTLEQQSNHSVKRVSLWVSFQKQNLEQNSQDNRSDEIDNDNYNGQSNGQNIPFCLTKLNSLDVKQLKWDQILCQVQRKPSKPSTQVHKNAFIFY